MTDQSRGGDKENDADRIAAHLAELIEARPSRAMTAGFSPKGARTFGEILDAARRIFVRDGHAGLSMRKVADEAGVALGNVNYYFGSKRALLEATLREALADYAQAHIAEIGASSRAPREILIGVMRFYVSNARSTHPLFFQIWGYAGSSDEAREFVRTLYRPIGRFIYYLVRASRPDLDDNGVRAIVLQLFSLEEGVKLFIGMGPDDDPALRDAERTMVALAERIIAATQ